MSVAAKVEQEGAQVKAPSKIAATQNERSYNMLGQMMGGVQRRKR